MSRFELHLALILVACPVILHAEQAVRADRSQTIREQEGVLRIYVGGVAVEFGEVNIGADSARVREGEDRVRFIGGISLRDSRRSIKAQTLVFHRRRRIARFQGSVVARDADGALMAQQVVYRLDENHLSAGGGVVLRYTDQGLSVEAENLTYDARNDSGLAFGHAALVRQADESRDKLKVHADSLAFSERGARVRFSGDVTFRQADISGSAVSGQFSQEEDELRLEGSARADWLQKQQSVEMRADVMSVRFDSGAIREINLRNSTEISTEHRLDGCVERKSIRAGQSEVRLDGVRIMEIHAREGVDGIFDLKGGGKADLSGQEISLVFKEETVDSLTLKGGGSVSYVPPGQTAESHLSGGTLSIRFAGGHVQRVVVQEQASCQHVPSGNEQETVVLSGDRIELDFVEGHFQKAVGTGGVHGSYAPKRQEGSGDAEN